MEILEPEGVKEDMSQEQHVFELDSIVAVAAYHQLIARLEAEGTEPSKEEFRHISLQLRSQWQDWEGEDSLHK